ncbi:MAG: hypothetical protein ABIK15_06115 [Pseudomonadota bacterium]
MKKKGFDRSAIDKLDAYDWPSIMPRLTKYARAKENQLINLGSDMVYSDIIQEAIARVYGQGKDGKYRNWDSERYPDLAKFLEYVMKDIVRSEILTLTQYTEEQLCWEAESCEERKLTVSPYDNSDAHQSKNSIDLTIDKEGAERLWRALEKISEEDGDLESIILSITDGKTKSEQISKETGLDIKDVYNLKRKLKRHLKEYKDKYGMNINPERKAE